MTELHDGVGLVRLARPEVLNAVTYDVLVALRSALWAFSADTACKAVVITGEGSSFCAGLDLRLGLRNDAYADPVEATHAGLRAGVEVILAIREIRPPVVAAVTGHAVGAGFALAAACDIRFASPTARFGAPFLSLGVTGGDFGLSWFLPRIIGAGRAAHLIYEAGTLDAQDAEAYGFARVVDDPLAAAQAFASRLGSFPDFGVTVTKQLLDASPVAGLRDHLDAEARAQALGLLTAPARAAIDHAVRGERS